MLEQSPVLRTDANLLFIYLFPLAFRTVVFLRSPSPRGEAPRKMVGLSIFRVVIIFFVRVNIELFQGGGAAGSS